MQCQETYERSAAFKKISDGQGGPSTLVQYVENFRTVQHNSFINAKETAVVKDHITSIRARQSHTFKTIVNES